MDVRIAYGIDIDEIPNKLSEMLCTSADIDVRRLLHVARELIELSEDNIPMAVEIINQARIKLASIDRSLNDCEMIMKGYVNAKTPAKEEVANDAG